MSEFGDISTFSITKSGKPWTENDLNTDAEKESESASYTLTNIPLSSIFTFCQITVTFVWESVNPSLASSITCSIFHSFPASYEFL